MSITPINLLPLAIARPMEMDIGLSPMERVENSARTGDETYSPSDGRSAEEPEDEQEKLESEDETGAQARKGAIGADGEISFFA